MGLTVKAGGDSGFVPVPAGMHLARCYRIIDLGTQKSEFQGKEKYQPKVMIQFEVHSEDEDGKPLVTQKGEPMSISKNYTASLAEMATLRADLINWRGRDFTPDELRGFELKNVLDKWAMINVTKALGKDGKEYTNIGSISGVPANIKKAGMPKPFNEAQMFTIDDPDMELFETFSEYLKNKIMSSPEWQETQGKPKSKSAPGFEELEDDIPF